MRILLAISCLVLLASCRSSESTVEPTVGRADLMEQRVAQIDSNLELLEQLGRGEIDKTVVYLEVEMAWIRSELLCSRDTCVGAECEMIDVALAKLETYQTPIPPERRTQRWYGSDGDVDCGFYLDPGAYFKRWVEQGQ